MAQSSPQPSDELRQMREGRVSNSRNSHGTKAKGITFGELIELKSLNRRLPVSSHNASENITSPWPERCNPKHLSSHHMTHSLIHSSIHSFIFSHM